MSNLTKITPKPTLERRIMFRLDDEMYARLYELARVENRSLSGQLRHEVQQALKAREKQAAPN